jgi:hypothetical protein
VPRRETLRDVGILVVVFGPLDAFFQSERTAALPLASMIVGGLILVTVGIMLETKE